MKFIRLSFCLITLFLMLSCKKEKKQERKQTKLEVYLKDFIKDNPNWNQNEIINKETNKTFQNKIANEISNGILDNFPLEFGEINEYKNGKFAALFRSHYILSDAIDYNNIIRNTYFDVIALISKDKIALLKKDKAYLIKGKFLKFLNDDYSNYIKSSVYSPYIKINKDVMSSITEVNIGIILMDISEIKEVPKL